MKKLVLFSVAALLVGFATNASAYNMIHPFYSPKKGKVVSNTSVEYGKMKLKEDRQKSYSKDFTEEVEFGLTDSMTIFGEFGRDWFRASHTDGVHWKSNFWGLGLSYDVINDSKNYMNVWGEYYQENDGDLGANKIYNLVGMYGYNFDAFTPYMVLSYANSLNHGSLNDEEWKISAIAYKEVVKDVGVSLGVNFKRNSEEKAYYGLAQVGYQLTDNLALNLYGHYLLNHDPAREMRDMRNDKHYKVGAEVSFEF